MIARVLLNLLNKLGKGDKMRDMQSTLSHARVLLNLLNKLGNRIKCGTCRALYHFFAYV